jgi:hypothetical protein
MRTNALFASTLVLLTLATSAPAQLVSAQLVSAQLVSAQLVSARRAPATGADDEASPSLATPAPADVARAHAEQAVARGPAAVSLQPYDTVHAFEREFAFGLYATGHTGSYLAAGLGARARWEPLELLGFEAYLEATLVESALGGLRHDYPNGFNVYVPLRFGDFRVRPFAGFCDVLSFVEPAQPEAPRADDVLFGAHAGLGVEVAVHSMFSVFADLQANVYAGHDRTSQGWTGNVGEQLEPFWNVQLNLGAQLHAGR